MDSSKTLIIGTWQFNYLFNGIIKFLDSNKNNPTERRSDINIAFVTVGEDDRSHLDAAQLDSLVGGLAGPVSWNGVDLIERNQITRLPCILISEKVIEDESIRTIKKVELFTEISDLELTQQEIDALFAKSVEDYNNFNIFSCMTGFYKLCLVENNDEKYFQSLFNMACAFHINDMYSLAVHYLRRLLEIKSDTLAHQVLWAIAQSERVNEIVLDTYRHLIDLNGDVFARQKLTLLTGSGAESVKSDPKYITMVYDNLADAFEDRLVNVLGYDAPWTMYKLVNKISQTEEGRSNAVEAGASSTDIRKNWRILDLGCGTGLIGKVFSPSLGKTSKGGKEDAVIIRDEDYYSRNTFTDLGLFSSWYNNEAESLKRHSYLIGVDVSKNMISHAQKTEAYDSFFIGDLNAFLPTMLDIQTQQMSSLASSIVSGGNIDFNLVIAADTFIYIGILGKVFSFISRILNSGGLFSFTTEDLEKSPMNNVEMTSTVEISPEDNEYEPKNLVWGKMVDSGRFAHSNKYILQLSHDYGFDILVHESIILRKEAGVPLGGNIFVLRKR